MALKRGKSGKIWENGELNGWKWGVSSWKWGFNVI
jgi:hypothetical protein